MRRSSLLAPVAVALGAGLLWSGPPGRSPAFAQSAVAPPAVTEPGADGSQTPEHPAEASPWEASATPDAPAVGAEATEATSERDAQTPQGDPQPDEASSTSEDGTTAAPSDGMSVDTPPASDEPAIDAAEADVPPVGPPTGTAAQLAQWVAATGDNDARPFVIVDKPAADVFVFAADGSLVGAAPVLVGETPGDDSAEGVGDRDLSAISPDERTTPAGRFVASFGAASGHRTVLWVDYATAISLHPVITTNPAEHRLERLQSPAVEDRRITYGCINVPKAFYRDVVLEAFEGGSGVVYILPEIKPLQDVFPAFALVARPVSAAETEPASSAPRFAARSAEADLSNAAATAPADPQDAAGPASASQPDAEAIATAPPR